MPRKSQALVRVDRLYNKGLILLEREMDAIDKLGRFGDKLDAGPAKDLRDYLKVLGDMKDAQAAMQAEREAKATKATKAASDAALVEAAGVTKNG